MLGLFWPLLLQCARIGGHVSGVKGAFAENRAEMIRQAKGNDEGIGDETRAEHRAEKNIAKEAAYA